MALRTPWYVCAREGFDRFDTRALAPAIQKYDTPDFIEEHLVKDPRRSLKFGADDLWTFAVPRGELATKPADLRARLSPFTQVSSNVAKLYQPSHQRFYALTIELFCDAPGLPRPGLLDEVEVKFVVRRLLTRFTQQDPAVLNTDLKSLARAVAKSLFPPDASFPAPTTDPDDDEYPPNDPTRDTAEDLARLFRFHEPDPAKVAAFEATNHELLQRIGMEHELQGWFVKADGRGSWQEVHYRPEDPAVTGEELELPMWPIPQAAARCKPARTRSLWFGVLPTYSGEFDDAGNPKLDDRTTYFVQCLARRRRRPPHQDCPPLVTWSGPSVPFRLASFFDPQGTANQRIHVKLPDFAAVAAQAAKGPSPGGVQFERPAGSQLPPGPLGKIPDGQASPTGDAAENCSFAIELITIVATFVFSLFLPVVVFVFQLWWLLMLKFCWPSPKAVQDLVDSLQNTQIVNLDPDEKQLLAGLLGVEAADLPKLAAAESTLLTSTAFGGQLGTALQPGGPPDPDPGVTPEDPPDDPLCPPGS
jgi:hypothetical protein